MDDLHTVNGMSMNLTTTLFIETATPRCSIGLQDTQGRWMEREVEGKGAHSKELTKGVHQLLNDSGLQVDEIQRIVLGGGPGSFTGLRIGASFVRGLCFGKEVPILMMDTLPVLAGRVLMDEANGSTWSQDVEIHAILDARRTHVYHWSGQWIDSSDGDRILKTIAPQSIRPIEELETELSQASAALVTGFGLERLSLKSATIQILSPPEHLVRAQKWLLEYTKETSFVEKTNAKDAVPFYLS